MFRIHVHGQHTMINVMVRAFTRYVGDLGKSRQPLVPKAWHTHGNTPHGGADFYPLLAEVGKSTIQEQVR